MGKKFLRKIISLFCACKKCPTLPQEEKEVITYCEFGKSRNEVKKLGCVCRDCFVWKVNKFDGYYYCIKGKDSRSKI